MDERLPPELFTKSGKRRPLQIKKIKYLFPELWERVLSSTDDSLTEKVRFELYLRGLYTFKTCIGIDCENKVTNHLSGQFCSTQCSKNSPITREKIESACIKKYGSKSSLDSKHVLLRETCPRIFDVSGRDKTTRFAWDCGDYIFLINDDLQ